MRYLLMIIALVYVLFTQHLIRGYEETNKGLQDALWLCVGVK